MNLGAVMQEIADRIQSSIGGQDGLTVHGFPPDKVHSPCAIVTYPESYNYDATYGRGSDRINNLPVVFLIGKVDDRTSRDRIGKYANGSGAASFKAIVEPGPHVAFDTIRVTETRFDIVTISGTEYLAATFTCDVVGRGTT